MTRRKKASRRPPRSKLNLTIHPDILEWAGVLARRRTISMLFEDLVEAEWLRQQTLLQQGAILAAPQHQPLIASAQSLANFRYQQSAQRQQ